MTFRDEREAQHQQIDSLERQLRDARGEIDRLRGRDASLPPSGGVAGAPLTDECSETLDGEIDDEARELIVEELRRRYGRAGTVSTVGRSLSWSVEPTQNQPGRTLTFTVTSRHGRTRIRASERHGMLAGGIFAGVGGGGGAGLGALLVVLLSRVFGITTGLLALPFWLLFVFVLSRAIFQATVRARQRELRAATSAIAEIAKEEIDAAPVPPRERTGVRADAATADAPRSVAEQGGRAEEVAASTGEVRQARAADSER